MTVPPVCPRCSGPLVEPGLWSSSWRCDRHGDVAPFHIAPVPNDRSVEHVRRLARVPVWLPEPTPVGWLVTGVGYAGDERTGGVGTVLALSGPSPVGGLADLLLVAEEPGIGLASRFAGMDGAEPEVVCGGPPHGKVVAAGHPTPLWSACESAEDRCCFVGEGKGLWLWAFLWPAGASLLLLENLVLADLRDGWPAPTDLAFGAPSRRLAA